MTVSTGIAPTLMSGRAKLQTALAQDGRALTGDRRLASTQAALVVFQFCASLILLVGAGLLIRSFVAVLNQPAGFRTDGVVALTVQTWDHYPEVTAREGFVRTIWQLNPAIAIYHETTMDDLVGASVQERRLLLVLLSSFAAMALVLAAAGIFGLMSFIIAQRTREYGIRLALGALREEVFSLVLKRGMTLAATGIALGLLGALALTRPLAGMLYDVSPFDPVTFALAVLVLCSTATVASLYPATRATGVNLNDALRND